MGTTRIKVIDLSSSQKEIKTSRKHAEKLAGPAKKEPKSKPENQVKQQEKPIEERQTQPSEVIESNEPEQVLEPQEQIEEKAPSSKPKPQKTAKQKNKLGANYKKA